MNHFAKFDASMPIERDGRDLHLIPRWPGECAAIIASGQSLSAIDLSQLRNRIHVVAINDSYKKYPEAEILYSCDVYWWQRHDGAKNFKGLKVTQDILATTMFADLIRVQVEPLADQMLTSHFGYIAAGGNSAFQAMNLLVQMGVAGIMLLGCDCFGQHWHGRHPAPCNNPDEDSFIRWMTAFDNAAPSLAALDVDVVNCSPISKITAYPKMSVLQAFERWGL